VSPAKYELGFYILEDGIPQRHRHGNFTSYRKRSSFQNVVSPSYLQFRKMDKTHNPSDSECYTRSSQWFTFYTLSFYVYISMFIYKFKAITEISYIIIQLEDQTINQSEVHLHLCL
jgi:hypothetical protein